MSKNEDKSEDKKTANSDPLTALSPQKTMSAKKYSFATSSAFDLNECNDSPVVTNKTTLLRIRRDLTEFYSSRMSTIHCVPQEDNIGLCHALIEGPEETPYARGFFYFTIRFPPDYPIRPPKVRLQTTGSGSVRFNPNLYANGYVCLSILNTWSGPQWSPVMNLTSVLLSIQSLMNEEPYYNEPGREAFKAKATDASQGQRSQRSVRLRTDMSESSAEYNKLIQWETLRVAVLDMIEGKQESDVRQMPKALKDQMVDSFRKHYFFYEKLISQLIQQNHKKLKPNPNPPSTPAQTSSSSGDASTEAETETKNSADESTSDSTPLSTQLFGQIDPNFSDLYAFHKQLASMKAKTSALATTVGKSSSAKSTEVFMSPLLSSYRRRLSADHCFDYSLLLKRLQEMKTKFNVEEEEEVVKEGESEERGSYSSIASNYMKESKEEMLSKQELKFEDIVDESDFYMEANGEDEEEYDLEYESDDSDEKEEKEC